MKLKLVLVAAAALASSSSFAVTSSTFGGQHDTFETASGTYFVPTDFVDVFSFTLAGAADLVSSITSATRVSFGEYSLFDVGVDTVAGTGDDMKLGGFWPLGTAAMPSVSLGAGSYYYKVSGKVVTNGTYSLGSMLTPVPEPETYAMMLAGLVAVGFLAGRRRNG